MCGLLILACVASLRTPNTAVFFPISETNGEINMTTIQLQGWIASPYIYSIDASGNFPIVPIHITASGKIITTQAIYTNIFAHTNITDFNSIQYNNGRTPLIAEDTADSDNLVVAGWTAADAGSIFISDDEGVTWSEETLPATYGPRAVFYINGVVWLLLSTGAVLKLYERTAASTFTERKQLTDVDTESNTDVVSIYQNGLIYFIGDNTKFYSVAIAAPYAEVEVFNPGANPYAYGNLYRVNDNYWIARSFTAHLIKSVNQGAAWTELSDPPDMIGTILQPLGVDLDNGYYYVGDLSSEGTVIWQYNGDTPTMIFKRGLLSYPVNMAHRQIGGIDYLYLHYLTEETASSFSLTLFQYADVGIYVSKAIVKNVINPTEARVCLLKTLPEIADAFCPDLVYSVYDSAPALKFQGKYFNHSGGDVVLIGVDAELHYLSASGAYIGATGDEVIDGVMDSLNLCTKGNIDDTGATVYTQTFTDATTLAQALNTYGRIGLGLIAVQSDSSIDFETLADLPSSARTLTYGTEVLKVLEIRNQNSKKYDKLTVIGSPDDTEDLQKTLGSGDNLLTVTRLDLHCKTAVDGFAAGVWAIISASEQISRIYVVEERDAMWMEVGSTCVVSGVPDVPYGTYIVIGMEYNLKIKKAVWTLCQTINIQPLVNDITNNLVPQGVSDSAGGGTAITLNTMADLAAGRFVNNIRMGTHRITGMGDPTAAQDAATKNSSEAFTNALAPQSQMVWRSYIGANVAAWTTVVDLDTIDFGTYSFAEITITTRENAFTNGQYTKIFCYRSAAATWTILSTIDTASWGGASGTHVIQFSGSLFQIQRGGAADNNYAVHVKILRGRS